MVTVNDLVKTAESQVGITERGYTNDVMFNTWFYGGPYGKKYGSWAAWCAAFTSWVCAQNGLKANVDYPHTAGVAVARSWAKARGRWVSPKNIKKGDLVVFLPYFSHIGIARANATGSSVATVEGNTSKSSSGSQRDGGGVWKRTRPLSQVGGGIRLSLPKTTTTTPPKPPTPKGLFGMTKRIAHGYAPKQVAAKGTTTHLLVGKDQYTIATGPAWVSASVKVDILDLPVGETCYLIIGEAFYKKGQPTTLGRELATTEVIGTPGTTTATVTGPIWQLFKDWKGKSPRLRAFIKPGNRNLTIANVSVQGARD